MSDFDVFYGWGQAMQRGEYIGLYPLPFNWLLSLLALLPKDAARVLIFIVSIALLVMLFKRRALLWMLYAPILEALGTGQLSVIWLALLAWGQPFALALLTLKPYLFPLALPMLVADRAKWRPFALWCAALYVPAFVIRPSWLFEWLQSAQTTATGSLMTISMWNTPIWVGILGALLMLLLIARREYLQSWRVLFTSYNIAFRWYDYTMLAQRAGGLILIPASWVVWWLSLRLEIAQDGFVHSAWPFVVLGFISAFINLRGFSEWLTIRSAAGAEGEYGDMKSKQPTSRPNPTPNRIGRIREPYKPTSKKHPTPRPDPTPNRIKI